MKKTIKKIACAALCAVILFCMAVPAFALTGYEIEDKNLTYIGVRARCTSNLTLLKAEGSLNLSYLPAYSINYLPEEDYSCTVSLVLKYSSLTVYPEDASSPGMHVTNTFYHSTIGSPECTKATFTYFVNGGPYIHKEVIE